MLKVIKKYPLAALISVYDNQPLITHLPLIYRETDGKLVGHIDIYNPQTDFLKDNREVTIVFTGPDCYISPAVYSTTQLPTYNYVRVHLKGKVVRIENDDSLKESLIIMTEFLERPEHRYDLKPDNPRMEGLLPYIKMFEITITEWEGKFKLSQDKKKSDMNFAKKELVRSNQQNIESFLNELLSW